MGNNFQDFPCNKCGWCCQRTPCPVGLYLGQEPLTACTFLRETNKNEFECGLILDEQNPIKLAAVKTLIFSGEGCSHIYGPSPTSLMRSLVAQGLTPRSQQWEFAKSNTNSEYIAMAKESKDAKSILSALEEFKKYCSEAEKI